MAEVTSGLFTYPVLMAADIILYDTHFVPVGKDQKQHIEIARDIAKKFNNLYGEIFVLPEEVINEDVQTIIGTDGRKMSKSYDNYIDIFAPDKELKKQVMRIQTDSTPVEAPKNPDTCNVFNLYKLIAPAEKVEEMRDFYLAGGYGYGAAKNALLEIIMEHFSEQREKFNFYMSNPEVLEQQLIYGEARVQKIANEKLTQVRKILGFE
jgi:tryptophanyl-tRNA synthetase